MRTEQDSNSSKIRAFLEQDVPPTGTPEWITWQKECILLGDSAPDFFIKALKTGNTNAQYAAILGLRLYGYSAYGIGFWEDLTYSVTKGRRTLKIKPKVFDPQPSFRPLAKR